MGSNGAALAPARGRHRRLAALFVLLATVGGVYLCLPKSWFVVPDDHAPGASAARQPAPAPGASSPAAPAAGQPAAAGQSAAHDPAAFKAAAERAPLDFAARSRYGMALAEAGHPAQAEPQLLAARRLAPDNPVVYHNLGVLYLNTGRLALADETFRRELEVAPGDARAHYYRGLALQRMRGSDQAIAQFRIASALDPNLPDAYLALAIEGTRSLPEEEIRRNVEHYIALTGNRGLAYYVLSGAYRTWQRYDAAARYGELSVAADPGSYAYWHNLGQIYSFARRTNDAQRALTKALGLARDRTTVLIELGINAEKAQRFANAAEYYRQALAAGPKNGETHQKLSRVYQRMGDTTAARAEETAFRQWERAVETDAGRSGQKPAPQNSSSAPRRTPGE